MVAELCDHSRQQQRSQKFSCGHRVEEAQPGRRRQRQRERQRQGLSADQLRPHSTGPPRAADLRAARTGQTRWVCTLAGAEKACNTRRSDRSHKRNTRGSEGRSTHPKPPCRRPAPRAASRSPLPPYRRQVWWAGAQVAAGLSPTSASLRKEAGSTTRSAPAHRRRSACRTSPRCQSAHRTVATVRVSQGDCGRAPVHPRCSVSWR